MKLSGNHGIIRSLALTMCVRSLIEEIQLDSLRLLKSLPNGETGRLHIPVCSLHFVPDPELTRLVRCAQLLYIVDDVANVCPPFRSFTCIERRLSALKFFP